MCTAVTCAYPRSTDAIERGYVEKAPTATGELPDGVGEKGAVRPGRSGGRSQETATGDCESTECRTRDERVEGKGDAVLPEPECSTWGAASRGERPDRNVIITDRRV